MAHKSEERSSDGSAITSMGTPHGLSLYVFIHILHECLCMCICVYAKLSHLLKEKDDLKYTALSS